MKKFALTLALLFPMTAQAADSGYVGVGWGGSTTADPPVQATRQIQLWYKVNDTRGFEVTIVGVDVDNPAIQRITLQVGSKIVGSCDGVKLCALTWKRTDMQSNVNSILVTVTNGASQRFGMPARIARP